MARGATRRTWVKMHITGWLHGSIRWQLEPDERSVWADLICMAGECGKDGKICDNDNNPFPRQYIANHLNLKQELLDRTIAKCRHEGRLENREDILIIVNWKYYQSEYDRQKPYREHKKEISGEKFIKGKHGHLVARTEEDIERIKQEKARRLSIRQEPPG